MCMSSSFAANESSMARDVDLDLNILSAPGIEGDKRKTSVHNAAIVVLCRLSSVYGPARISRSFLVAGVPLPMGLVES
jgi:hypothetical protein